MREGYVLTIWIPPLHAEVNRGITPEWKKVVKFKIKPALRIFFYGFWIWILVFNATFSNIMATSFSGGRGRSTRRESLTMGK